MLRKILMTSVAATAMVGSAYAADLPSRKAPPMAYAPPVPIFTWTGFYVGVNGGGMFRANNNNGYNNAFFFGGAAPVVGFNNNNNNGRFLGRRPGRRQLAGQPVRLRYRRRRSGASRRQTE